MHDYEKPLIDATIYYYDIEYKRETAQKVLDILKRHNLFPPEKICLGPLTRNKYLFASDQTEKQFVDAYAEKDVFLIDMASAPFAKPGNLWEVHWTLTYCKGSDYDGTGKFMPWNILTISSTHGRMHDPLNYEQFFSAAKELIELLDPFYANIDDVSNSVKLMRKSCEKHFSPDHVQQIYWGNYFGKQFCENIGREKIMNIPVTHIEPIGQGIYFTLTNSVFDFSSRECDIFRKAIKQSLKL